MRYCVAFREGSLLLPKWSMNFIANSVLFIERSLKFKFMSG